MAAQNSVLVQIARPYAQALFDLAKSENALADVEANLKSITGLVNSSNDFSRFLRSPVLSADIKAEAIDAVLARGKTSPMVENLIRVVARNGRLFALETIIAEFNALAAGSRNEATAEVTSAAPLKPAQVKALSEALKAKIGKTVVLTQFVDPSLIGGLVVKVGSQMIDSSLKTKLSAMKLAMKEVG